jgi:hypothetical protein
MTQKSDVLLEIAQFENQYDVYDEEQNKSIALNIYEQVDRFVDGIEPTAQEIAQLTVAINKNVQVRDFVVGLPKERNIDFVGHWANFVGGLTPTEYSAPIATIMSSIYFSVGDTPKAIDYIALAYQSDPRYSMAKLLERVYQAGWEPESMNKMRDELHDKVKEQLGI